MKQALVTGATGGIGQALTRVLLDEGYAVTGIGRDIAKNTIESKNLKMVSLDLMDEKALDNFIRTYDSRDLYVLVNAAGSAWYGMHEEIPVQGIHEMTRVNLEVPMLLCRAWMRDIRRNQGTIINICSVISVESAPHGAAYGALKSGLYAFTKSLFLENRKFGVKVTAVLPDLTDTELYRHADFVPSEGKCLCPEDVGEAVKFVLDHENMITDTMILRPQYYGITRKQKK